MAFGDHSFPSPIGGIPFPHDFAPALFFTILYAIVVPVGVYRLISKRSRTLAIAGTVVFMVERVADFAIRAVKPRNPAFAPEFSLSPGYKAPMAWVTSA